jgi:hypothetical protein
MISVRVWLFLHSFLTALATAFSAHSETFRFLFRRLPKLFYAWLCLVASQQPEQKQWKIVNEGRSFIETLLRLK